MIDRRPGGALLHPAALLAIADDIQAGIFLIAERQPDGVVLGLLQPIGRGHPRSEELVVRIGEPGRFGKAAREGGSEHGRSQ